MTDSEESSFRMSKNPVFSLECSVAVESAPICRSKISPSFDDTDSPDLTVDYPSKP